MRADLLWLWPLYSPGLIYCRELEKSGSLCIHVVLYLVLCRSRAWGNAETEARSSQGLIYLLLRVILRLYRQGLEKHGYVLGNYR